MTVSSHSTPLLSTKNKFVSRAAVTQPKKALLSRHRPTQLPHHPPTHEAPATAARRPSPATLRPSPADEMAASLAPPTEAAQLRSKQLHIAAVVSAYFFISISLVFLNKMLMNPATSVDAPLFMTMCQCAIATVICWACGEAGRRTPTGAAPSFFSQFPSFTYRLDVARKLLPLSLVFVGMVTFNNLCLKYVEVSFYNVARSLTIVFNVLLTFFMLGERTSPATLGCLAAVVAGFFLGAEGEVNFSLVGTLFGVASSVFVSLNSIYTKKSMPLVENNQWTLAAYNNANAVLLFIPLVIGSGELSVLAAAANAQLATPYYWGMLLVSGCFGFAIGIVTIMQITVTSPLTHNISGTAKACVQTVLALYLWQNATTFNNLAGNALVLAGSFSYAWVRNTEMGAASAARTAAAKAAELKAVGGEEEGAEGEDDEKETSRLTGGK